MIHCCIIGGTGFIGSHVVEKLLSQERQITVVGRNPVPSRILPEGVRYIAHDYGDLTFLMEVLKDVDEVINLAYATVPKTSSEDPIQDVLSNLPAAISLFKAASETSVRKLVLVSSGGTVYGKTKNVPISEDHPTNPISPYGITKLAIEKYAKMYNELKALPVVCVRPSNAFGEGQRPFTGQGFIATAIASILEQREISVFGEIGTIRDYIHVTDAANGIIAVLEHGIPGTCYNIGSGVGRSNQDVLDAVHPFAESAGLQVRVKRLPRRPFDVPVNVLDCTQLGKETGWRVTIPFKEGIERTWNWFLLRTKHRNHLDE